MDSGTWSVIGTNFDPDDETANFGTRRALEAEGRLFDVFTYATIDPRVCGILFNKDKSLQLSRGDICVANFLPPPPLNGAGLDQGWANPEKFSVNPENTDNYFWKMYMYI